MISRFRLSFASALALVAGFALPSLASAETLYGLTAAGTGLVTFDSAAPATFTAPVVLALPDGVTLLGIDVRPSTGVIYGLGSDSTLYTVTEAGVVATVGALGTALDFTAQVGFDFNNVSEGIRVATDNRQNLRLNAGTGVATVDTSFDYANGSLADVRADGSIQLSGVAYTPVAAGATRLFGIDSNNRELVVITAAAAAPGPNLFEVTPVPAPPEGAVGGNTLGIDPTDSNVGFDISPSGVGYVSASDGPDAPSFYTVALTGNTAGEATLVATLAADLRDIAVKIIPAGPTDGGTDGGDTDGGEDGGSTSSSGGSSGASSSSGRSSGASSSSGGSSGRSGSSGASGTSGSSGTSGADGGVGGDLGIDGLGGGGCITAASTDGSPWSAAACTVALGLALVGLRRRNRR